MARLLSLAVAAAAAAFAAAAGKLRVAIYSGGGVAPGSAGNYTESCQQLAAKGVIASATAIDETQVPGIVGQYDVVIFPGGSGGEEAAAIGVAGANAVRQFVSSGGGYVGTCAGSYLAGTASCCDVSMPGYCSGQTGCHNSSYALGLVDMGVAEPWDRGVATLKVSFTEAAVAMLKLNASKYGPNAPDANILYWQGPVQDRKYPDTGYTTDAYFRTEVASKHPQWTRGQQVNTPALLHTTYGQGRVILSSPHPEETVPRLDDLIEAYVLWAGREI